MIKPPHKEQVKAPIVEPVQARAAEAEASVGRRSDDVTFKYCHDQLPGKVGKDQFEFAPPELDKKCQAKANEGKHPLVEKGYFLKKMFETSKDRVFK